MDVPFKTLSMDTRHNPRKAPRMGMSQTRQHRTIEQCLKPLLVDDHRELGYTKYIGDYKNPRGETMAIYSYFDMTKSNCGI